MQHNAVPIVHRLRIHSAYDRTDLRLRLQMGDGFSLVLEETLSLRAGETWERVDLPLLLKAHELVSTLETTRSYLLLELFHGDDLIHQQHWPVEVLAYNHWAGMRGLPDLLCSFVLPHHPAVSELVKQAGHHLAALDGYQSGQAYEQARALYQAVQDWKVQYLQGSEGWLERGQKVRTPDQLLQHRQGNCLDLTLLMAAGLRRVGLHALIVLVEGHAFPGFWLRPEDDPDGALADVSTMLKCLALGLICLFDSSSACSGLPFEKAEAVARTYLTEEKFQLALDLRASERQGIRPLPLRLTAAGEVMLIHEEGRPERDPNVLTVPEVAPAQGQALPREAWEKRLHNWKNRLLDITTRNRLLDLRRDSNRRLLPLLLEKPQELLEQLLGGASYTLIGRPRLLTGEDPRSLKLAELQAGEDVILREVEENFRQRRLQVDLDDGETQRRSLELFRADRVNLEETGSSTLFLALGSLRWTETDKASVRRSAPLALLPVELVRVRVHEPYKLRWRGEDIRINLTLLRKLQADFKIDLGDLEAWPGCEGETPQLAGLLQRLRSELLNQSGWNLFEDCAIGSFSFAKLLMLQDLERFPNLQSGSPMLRSFLTSELGGPQPLLSSHQVDERSPAQSHCVVDADSSQLAAIYSSQDGASFVLQGPPGTGKSQTITNMIAQNLAQGRTVLFVAEKLAALEVVYRRLQHHGLGPFCLQLHSNKASKGEILSQLRESLDYQAPPPAKDATGSLEELRSELNDYVEWLHGHHPLGLSVYEAIGRCSQLTAYPTEVCEVPAEFNQLEAVRRSARELRIRAQEVGNLARHPWRESRLAQWDGRSRERLALLLRRGQEILRAWQSLLQEGERLWSLGSPPRASQLAGLHKLVELLLRSPLPQDALLDRHPWREVRALLDPALDQLERRQQAWAQLSEEFQEGLLKLDLSRLRQRYQQWMSVFLLGWVMLWSSRRQLRRVSRGRLGQARQIVEQLDIALEVRQLDEQLKQAPLHDLLGSRWLGPQSHREELLTLLSWAEQFRQQASEVQVWPEHAPWLAQMRAACNREERLEGESGGWLQTYLSLSGQLQAWLTELQQQLQLQPVERSWGQWQQWLELQLTQLDRLSDWTLFQEASQQLERLGLSPVLDGLWEERIGLADLEGACEHSLLQGWLQAVVPHRFRGSLQAERVQQFRHQDQQRLLLAQRELVTRLSDRIPPVQEQGARGEMAVLLRELKKQRNLKAPRQLFKEVGNLLTRLKPCLLMSPLSIAQYLDPSNPPFDLVIFDEASQIAPWDALGALARGTQWVVVGDSRQLPPTSFFAAQVEEDDEEVDLGGSLESILDECSAAGLPQLTLNWHYRSSDERLIAFSNRHYYDGRLMTFPNAQVDHPAQGVHWIHVAEGVFARSASRTNRPEAERLVEHLVHKLRQPDNAQSFGVVTFNQAQQGLIENLLDQARSEFPEIEPHFVDRLEPVFVKNLENVQGDERDVIYFSIAYAPDPQGRFRMEFGPLNRQGGERRLNVAVSRARQQMWVFSSIQPEQIDLNRAQARGARDLRAFLEYARRGGVLSASRPSPLDPLTHALQAALQQRGWQVEINLGSSHYQIDLAVLEGGRYLAGIEWDGPHYREAHSARDRDRLRPSVLSGLGWRLIRVWAPDWWRDPQRVLEELEEALRQQPLPSPPPPPQSAVPEPMAQPEPATEKNPSIRPYQETELRPPAGQREPHQVTAAQFLEMIEPVLVAEGPLTPRYLFTRVARALGARSLGSRMRTHFDSLVQVLAQKERLWIDSQGALWASLEQCRQFEGFRTGPRDLADVPQVELEATIAYEMALAISLSESELVRSVARHYGKQKAGREVIVALLQSMLERGRCRRHQDNWVWVG
jgi:hypothetical protein